VYLPDALSATLLTLKLSSIVAELVLENLHQTLQEFSPKNAISLPPLD
jgi:hypothetical protein